MKNYNNPNKNMNGLLEILTNKKWMMHPESLHTFRNIIQNNINGHVALGQFEKKQAWRMAMSAEGDTFRMAMPGSHVEHDDNEPSVQSYVCILPVCGPITRNGDACSYGSVDLRDVVIEAVSEEECSGVIFYINSPGGSAAAIPDFKYAINYAHEHGKECIAFVDGMCASAAMYLAALCDGRYYMNDQDMIGSIGVMAAFYTLKDGEKNEYTNQTYHELYAKESYEKNKWYRDACEGNYEDLLADLDNLADQFMADVKAACPNATDEHLHGATFNAVDVDGILMDGKTTLDAVIASLLDSTTQHPTSTTQATNTQTTIDMNNYPLTQAVLGVEELVVTEEGTFLNVALLDANEKALADKDAAITEANEKVANAEKALADAQAHSKEIEEQLATAMNDKEEADKTLAGKDDEIKALADAKAQLEADLKGAKDALATAEQSLADKDAQIAKLTSAPAKAEGEGESPANNGAEPQTPAEEGADYPTWDGKESMTEFRARKAAWLKSHGL